MKLLVTGFGPFLGHSENPSAVLASGVGGQVLEVSYGAVDEFLESVGHFDSWLALGLAAKSSTLLYETVGRNAVSGVPDVLGEARGPGPIDPSGPWQVSASLWHGMALESDLVRASTDAGGYLCNYLLYQALRQYPEKRIGFLHVPPFSAVSAEVQEGLVAGIIDVCRGEDRGFDQAIA